jgi:hypothetical protein
MLMVEPDPVRVEQALGTGGLSCPGCRGVVGPWGHAPRRLRGVQAAGRVRLRRGRCRACGVTHVLLPVTALARRRDAVEVIGAALVAKAAGLGHRPIADELGRPRSTVRGWLRRFAARAGSLRAQFTRLAYQLDAELDPICPRPTLLAEAVEAIGVAAAAAARRLGVAGSPWQFAAGATGGWLLGAPGNTSGLLAAG